MTISGPPYLESTQKPSNPTPISAPSSALGRKRREIECTINGAPFLRKAPTAHRDVLGDLDIEELTRRWVSWRRLECNGADMGGVHTLEAGYSRGKMFRPGGGRCLVELEDRAGRHWPHWERIHHGLSKALEVFKYGGMFA